MVAPPNATGDGLTETGRRDRGLDALRVVLTVLVVFHHAAITYGATGDWFYREVAPSASATGLLLILFVAFNQAWFMGLFFLIAGFLTPGAISRHGARGYARERLVRLGIPLIVFGLVVGPATEALAGTARGRPFWPSLLALWRRIAIEPGPLWFAEALLLFGAAALVWRGTAELGRWGRATPVPSPGQVLAAVLAVGTVAFAVRLVWPVGRQAYGLQPGYFAGYVALFAAGCVGAGGRWWTAIPFDHVRAGLVAAALAFPVLPLVVLAGPAIGLAPGRTEGGWTVGAAVYAFWEPLVAWGVILGLLWSANRLEPWLGPAWSRLGRASYAAFVVHAPILVAVTLAWRRVQAPPAAKFLLAGLAAATLAFAAALLLRRVPILRRVL